MGKNNMAPPRTFHFIIPCFLLDIHAEAWGISNIEHEMMKEEGGKEQHGAAQNFLLYHSLFLVRYSRRATVNIQYRTR